MNNNEIDPIPWYFMIWEYVGYSTFGLSAYAYYALLQEVPAKAPEMIPWMLGTFAIGAASSIGRILYNRHKRKQRKTPPSL